MAKIGSKTGTAVKAVAPKRILISQPKPESDKSPYYDLERKYQVELVFHPFIKLDGIPAKDFRKQKIDIAAYTGVIFTSRNAIDHFFRTAEEMKVSISQDTKYFCITEAVALYLQKFILYRKRKVFYGADGSSKSMLDVINKHKENEKFLYVFDNFPDFKQNKIVIGAFGSNTSKAVEDATLRLDIKAPVPQRTSLVAALDHYLQSLVAKK